MNSFAASRRAMLLAASAGLALGAIGCATTGQAQTTPAASPRDRLREAMRQKRAAKGAPETPQDLPTTRVSDRRATAGRFAVSRIEDVWRDAARGDRAVPWRAYCPDGLTTLAPVVVFSHGGGGTRASGAAYGEHLASHGFLALHLQHLGSDRDAFRENPQQISAGARDPQIGAVRFQDVTFAWRQLQSSGSAGALSGKADPTRVGISGHSFGAITAQIVAGQFVKGFDQSLATPQMKGAFALSPSPPRPDYADVNTAFRDMLMPMFHLTGTEDDAPNGDFEAPARRIPFDKTNDVDQFLVILRGANHFTFGGDPNPQLRGQSFAYPGLERHHDLIKTAAVAFWGWTMNGNGEERSFLEGGGFKALLGAGDVFETKRAR